MKDTAEQPWWKMLRVAVAMVWIYQGLWHKLLAVDVRHLEIVSAAPALLPPRVVLGLIGMLETFFGVAIFSKWRQRLFGKLQIGMLVVMNAAGIIFAGDKIQDIGGMLTMNFVFALSIWGLTHHGNER
jgi:uncharacterized membrane protein YphA (DoxX/SURF4 family)